MGTQLPPKRVQQPPSFRPMSVVAKQSPISATGKHLLTFSGGEFLETNGVGFY